MTRARGCGGRARRWNHDGRTVVCMTYAQHGHYVRAWNRERARMDELKLLPQGRLFEETTLPGTSAPV